MFRFYFGHRFRFHDSCYKKKKESFGSKYTLSLVGSGQREKNVKENDSRKKILRNRIKFKAASFVVVEWRFFFSLYILNSLFFLRDFFHRTHTYTQFSLRILKFNLTSNRKKEHATGWWIFFFFYTYSFKVNYWPVFKGKVPSMLNLYDDMSHFLYVVCDGWGRPLKLDFIRLYLHISKIGRLYEYEWNALNCTELKWIGRFASPEIIINLTGLVF